MTANALLRSAAPRALVLGGLLLLLSSHATAQPAELLARLRAHVVTHDDFARSDFYTWTSPEQIAALRSSKILLVAKAQDGGPRPSPFIRMLRERVERKQPGHEMAALLLNHPPLARRRYAWTSPFATVLGLGERSYGTELIKVTLLPSALIVRFDPEAAIPFSFVNLRGESVPYSDGIARPERIGAIYHVRTRGPSDFVPFREYILCNEAMVQSFSVATPEIRARLAEETALLHALRPHFATLPPAAATQSAVPAWSSVAKDASLLLHWRAASAFDNRKYRPQVKNLDKIIAGLATYGGSGPPLIHSPQPH